MLRCKLFFICIAVHWPAQACHEASGSFLLHRPLKGAFASHAHAGSLVLPYFLPGMLVRGPLHGMQVALERQMPDSVAFPLSRPK
jgi:hypothetical protein